MSYDLAYDILESSNLTAPKFVSGHVYIPILTISGDAISHTLFILVIFNAIPTVVIFSL
jgi:hypothetical protein